MTDRPIRVVKIGGSLLDLPDLAERLDHWQRQQPAMQDVWIVGGGQPVEELRKQFALGHIDQHEAHWAAVGLMGANAHALAKRLHRVWVQPFGFLAGHLPTSCMVLLDVVDFMHNIEPYAAGQRLPAIWDVTSDSIAGRVSIVLKAAELILLKSTHSTAASRSSLGQLAARGIVDPFLPRLASELPPVTLINLRAQTASCGLK